MIKCKNCGIELAEELEGYCYICETEAYEQVEICEFCGKEKEVNQILCECLKDL